MKKNHIIALIITTLVIISLISFIVFYTLNQNNQLQQQIIPSYVVENNDNSKWAELENTTIYYFTDNKDSETPDFFRQKGVIDTPEKLSTVPYPSHKQGNYEYFTQTTTAEFFDEDKKLMRKNLETNQIEEFMKLGNPCYFGGISNTGKYFLLDCGTSPVRQIDIVSTTDKSSKTKLTTSGNKVFFGKDDSFVIYAKTHLASNTVENEKEILNRPWDAGEATSIVKLDLNSMKETYLAKATKTEDYLDLNSLIFSVENNKIIFSKITTNSNPLWEKYSTTYYEMDLDGGNKVEKLPKFMSDSTAIETYLKTKNYIIIIPVRIIPHKKYSDWYLVSFNDSDSKEKFSVLNMKNLEGTFKIIGEGTAYFWE